MLSFIVEPGRLPTADRFETEVAAAIDYVKASPPADPALPVLVAGEPELMSRAERTANGVPIEEATWEELRVAAESVGTTLEG